MRGNNGRVWRGRGYLMFNTPIAISCTASKASGPSYPPGLVRNSEKIILIATENKDEKKKGKKKQPIKYLEDNL